MNRLEVKTSLNFWPRLVLYATVKCETILSRTTMDCFNNLIIIAAMGMCFQMKPFQIHHKSWIYIYIYISQRSSLFLRINRSWIVRRRKFIPYVIECVSVLMFDTMTVDKGNIFAILRYSLKIPENTEQKQNQVQLVTARYFESQK